MKFNPTCFADYVGPWAIEIERFQAYVELAKEHQPVAAVRADVDGMPLFDVEDGVAVIPISGPMMKGDSKFGGASTIRTRRALRAATNDPGVRSIVLQVDSPGGTVAGTEDLALDVRTANSVKPVFAVVEDLMASAALWAVSGARRITATNDTAEIGSIGVFTMLVDSSKAAEMQGIKVIPVTSGIHKATGMDGVEVTDEQVAAVQSRIDDLSTQFVRAVARGRDKMSVADVRAVADGRMFGAKEAVSLGLIDGIESFDTTMTMARRRGRKPLSANAQVEIAMVWKGNQLQPLTTTTEGSYP